MKALIIGYGSIGRRHEEVLNAYFNFKEIHIVTKQKIKNKKTFKNLENIKNINDYNYYIIASETYKHYSQLSFLEKNANNKIILCEKPLFDDYKELEIKSNLVFVGYVLRFHPLLQKLKTILKNEIVFNVNVYCGQYLPHWRNNINYKNSYSAHSNKGGGVLLDLSHEIDYIQWLFGDIKEVKSYQTKISDLEIESDDLTVFIGKTNKNVIFNVSLDYISKIPYRKLIVNTINKTYEVDLINNFLKSRNKDDIEEILTIKNIERNYIFKNMHQSILSNKKDITTFEEGKKIMKIISFIKKENNEKI